MSLPTTRNRSNAMHDVGDEEPGVHGTVVLTTLHGRARPGRPVHGTMPGGTTPLQPIPVTPNATRHVDETFHQRGARSASSAAGCRATQSSPYLTDHFYPVRREHRRRRPRLHLSSGSGLVISAANTGDDRHRHDELQRAEHTDLLGGTVNLTVEGGPQPNGVLPSGSAWSRQPDSFVLNRNGRQDVTISVNGGTLGPGEYPLTIRATGTNSAGQVVTRLIPFTFDVATAGTSSRIRRHHSASPSFRITAANSNSIDGYAITGVYADMNDPALRRGQVARLVPWN